MILRLFSRSLTIGLACLAVSSGCIKSTQSPTQAQPTAVFEAVTLVTNLEHPWGMAWLPDGSLLITERPGRLRLVKQGTLDPTPIQGLPKVFVGGQAGLMDVSVHPRFSANRWVYLTYAHGSGEANQTRVLRGRLEGTQLQDVKEIFTVTQLKPGAQHFGSRMVWLPDETLLVSIGDGGNPPLTLEGELIRLQAQNLNSYLGKVIRIREDGSFPPDNPLAKQGKPAIWSYGHRNIQGMAYDPLRQKVWATEHGSRGGDELNWIQAGKNYGWPLVTHSQEYSGGEISSQRSRPGLEDSLVVWTPAIAPSGLMVYGGDQFPQWQGDLFAGGLVSQDIRRIDLNADGTVIGQESLPLGQRVRDVRQGPDGGIYVLTDQRNGQLLRLDPKRP